METVFLVKKAYFTGGIMAEEADSIWRTYNDASDRIIDLVHRNAVAAHYYDELFIEEIPLDTVLTAKAPVEKGTITHRFMSDGEEWKEVEE